MVEESTYRYSDTQLVNWLEKACFSIDHGCEVVKFVPNSHGGSFVIFETPYNADLKESIRAAMVDRAKRRLEEITSDTAKLRAEHESLLREINSNL